MPLTGTLPPVARLVVTLLLCLVPTVAFFGLLRGLERIRDDDLINEWAAAGDEEIGEVDLAAVLAGESAGSDDGSETRSAAGPGVGAARAESAGEDPGDARDAGTDDGAVRCRHCGAPNPEGVTFCAECVERL